MGRPGALSEAAAFAPLKRAPRRASQGFRRALLVTETREPKSAGSGGRLSVSVRRVVKARASAVLRLP